MTKEYLGRKILRTRNTHAGKFLTEAVDPIIPANKHPDPAFIIINKDEHQQFEKKLQYYNQVQTLNSNVIWPQHLTEVGKGGKEKPPRKPLSQMGKKIRQTSVVKKRRQTIKANRKWDEREVWRQQSYHKLHLNGDRDVKVKSGSVKSEVALDPFETDFKKHHICFNKNRTFLRLCNNDFEKECKQESMRSGPYHTYGNDSSQCVLSKQRRKDGSYSFQPDN
jgi:hypothetical protein